METENVTFRMRKKGLFRTILDDHRDASMLRHALCMIYLKLSGKSSGKTPRYTEDETGYVRPILMEVAKLQSRIKELEETVLRLEGSKN